MQTSGARYFGEGAEGGDDEARGGRRRDLALLLAAAAALQAIAWAVIYQVMVRNQWGYVPRPTGDVSYYANVAYSIVHGMWPYRDFPFEYPPLSVLAFLASPVSGTLEHYQRWFSAEMIVVDVLTAVVTTLAATRMWRGAARPLAAAAALAACVVAAGAIGAARFDPVVALILALALACILYRRFTWAGIVLGLGFAFKLTPVVAVPLVLVLAGRRREMWRAGAAAVVAGLVPFLPFLAIGARALAGSFVGQQVARGVQVESLAATPYLLAQVVRPGSATVVSPPGGSLVVVGPGTALLASLAPLAVLLLLAGVYFAVWRSRARLRTDGEAVPVAMLAAALASMLGNKVLSPQHLLWVVPLTALCLVGRPLLHKAIGASLVCAFVLTQIEYPGMYWRQVEMDSVPFVVIAVRNILLVAAFVLAVVRIWRLRSESGETAACRQADGVAGTGPALCPSVASPSAEPAEAGDIDATTTPAAGEHSSGGTVRGWRPTPAALWAAAAFVAGRVVTLLAGLAAWRGRGLPPSTGRWMTGDLSILLHGPLGRVIDPWVAWDGAWFASIAQLGYRGPQSPAFFPAYPYVVRMASAITGNVVLAGVAVSLVCAAAAMVVLYKMVATRFGAPVAAWAVAFLSLCPTSLFFGSVYSESLLLLLVVGAIALAERGLWVAACAAGALAALTRNIGVLVCLPLLFTYAESRGWTMRRVRLEWPRDARLAWLGLVPAGLAAFMLLLWSRFGDALAFVTVQSAWARSFALPPVTVWRALRQAGHAVRVTADRWPPTWVWLGPAGDGQWMYAMVLLPFVAFVAALVVLVAAWRRLPAAYNVWALVVVLVPLFSPARDQALLSYPRFLLLGFPLFVGLALVTERRTLLRWTLLAVSVLLLVWLSASFALFSWVA